MSDFPKMHLTAYGEREEGCGECFFFALHVVVLPMVLILNDKARRGGGGWRNLWLCKPMLRDTGFLLLVFFPHS